MMSRANSTPTVSIILPTYNRVTFLPDAFASIRAQVFQDWELIIVDDGSTYGTTEVVRAEFDSISQNCILVHQENTGPAKARMRGVEAARGAYIAFYDSDDIWHLDHLNLGMEVLCRDPTLDWVYFACRRVIHASGECIAPSTFYHEGVRNPLFAAAVEEMPGVFVIQRDAGIRTQILGGIDSGLQNSLIKASLVRKFGLQDFRVGEDRLLILSAVAGGHRIAFKDQVTVTYCVHDQNISDTNANQDFSKRAHAIEELLRSYHAAVKVPYLTDSEICLIEKKISAVQFWELSYNIYMPAEGVNLSV